MSVTRPLWGGGPLASLSSVAWCARTEVVDSRGALARSLATVAGWGRTAWAALTRSGVERAEALLLVKAAVPTVLAWQLAVRLLDSPYPFYAPMAALLVVDRTIVRSIGACARRVTAVVVGMSIAWLVGSLVGVTWWSMVVVMFVAVLTAAGLGWATTASRCRRWCCSHSSP